LPRKTENEQVQHTDFWAYIRVPRPSYFDISSARRRRRKGEYEAEDEEQAEKNKINSA
jgi:hypothetical protein